jgi:hypothetical protein
MNLNLTETYLYQNRKIQIKRVGQKNTRVIYQDTNQEDLVPNESILPLPKEETTLETPPETTLETPPETTLETPPVQLRKKLAHLTLTDNVHQPEKTFKTKPIPMP